MLLRFIFFINLNFVKIFIVFFRLLILVHKILLNLSKTEKKNKCFFQCNNVYLPPFIIFLKENLIIFAKRGTCNNIFSCVLILKKISRFLLNITVNYVNLCFVKRNSICAYFN